MTINSVDFYSISQFSCGKAITLTRIQCTLYGVHAQRRCGVHASAADVKTMQSHFGLPVECVLLITLSERKKAIHLLRRNCDKSIQFVNGLCDILDGSGDDGRTHGGSIDASMRPPYICCVFQ